MAPHMGSSKHVCNLACDAAAHELWPDSGSWHAETATGIDLPHGLLWLGHTREVECCSTRLWSGKTHVHDLLPPHCSLLVIHFHPASIYATVWNAPLSAVALQLCMWVRCKTRTPLGCPLLKGRCCILPITTRSTTPVTCSSTACL